VLSGEPGQLYFPIDCVIAILTPTRVGPAVETSTVGREGMCGTHRVWRKTIDVERWIGQVPGRALRLDAGRFAELCRRDPAACTIVARYLDGLVGALAQTVACNRLHLVLERCARWLLTIGDRVASPSFPLTHETLATTLGVRRAGISVAAATLQRAGYISYRRGKFHIIDPAGLESAACECYGAVRTIYNSHAAS
jgi:hypothetical protein